MKISLFTHYDDICLGLRVIICGNPLETEEQIEESLQLISTITHDPNDALSCLRLHVFPQTTLERKLKQAGYGVEDTQGWLYQACLYQLRWVCDDEEFDSIRHSKLVLENPYHMVDIIRRKRWEHLVFNKIPNLSWGINNDIVPYYAFVLEDLDFCRLPAGIIIWGASERYHELVFLFRKAWKKTLVDDSPALQGTTVDGMTVQGPDKLRDSTAPVFVLSSDKQAVWQKLRDMNPGIHVV